MSRGRFKAYNIKDFMPFKCNHHGRFFHVNPNLNKPHDCMLQQRALTPFHSSTVSLCKDTLKEPKKLEGREKKRKNQGFMAKKAVLAIPFCIILAVCCLAAYRFGYNIGEGAGYKIGYSEGYGYGNSTGFQIGSLSGYEVGFEKGNATGYSSGYNVGFNDGYEIGYGEGNVTGYAKGYKIGYEEWYGKGREEGYNFGFLMGNDTGYTKGYEVGYIQGVKDGAGRSWNIRDPTYREMLDFIAEDQTDKNEYSETYRCFHFTADVKQNALKAGYRCGFVYIEFTFGSHAIVCFNTTDRGIIFIEPQTDEIVQVVVGKFYERIYIAGTIKTYLIIW
jgi:hypothetical protein